MAAPAEGPVVLGDLLGTSRDRPPGSGTRIEPVDRPTGAATVPPPPPPSVPAPPAPPTGVTPGPVEPAAAAPVAPVPATAPAAPVEGATGAAPAPRAPGESRRRAMGVLVFAAVVVAGTFVGIRSTSVGDALRTVSVVLVAAAVLIYIAAFVLWLRNRGRRAAAAAPPPDTVTVPAPAVAAPASPAARPAPSPTPVPAPVASPEGEPRVPTLAEVAAELDAAAGRAVPVPVPVEAVAAPADPPVAAAVPPPPPPVPAAPAAPQVDVVAEAPADPPASSAGDHDGSVLDAIAPYTHVVGTPVIRYEPVPAAPVTPNGNGVAAPAATGTVPPPPPPAVVPPPPPPPARSVVPPPPPPVPSPPPPARTAAEVFAAMAATQDVAPGAASDGEPTGPLPIEAVAHAHPGAATRPDPRDGVVDLFADAPPAEPVPPARAERATGGPPSVPLSAPASTGALVPAEDVPGWTPPVPAMVESQALANLPGADVAARSAVGSVAPVVVYRYRKWVLGQMTPGSAFGPVDVDRSPDEWLLLATCGVATLLAWTHEDHHFTYPVETWVDEILPAHGVRIRDTDLAHDLIMAAALHAGGVDSVPTERLRTYAPGDLVTAMASIHVGLLRLYCGLGRIEPERVLADQYGIGPGDIPLH